MIYMVKELIHYAKLGIIMTDINFIPRVTLFPPSSPFHLFLSNHKFRIV